MLDTRRSPESTSDPCRHPRAPRPWRPVDEMVLRALVHARTDRDEIARRLDRSPGEIHRHLVRLELA